MTAIRIHQTGLAFGGFLALFHALWALLVLLGIAEPLLDWILRLHFFEMSYELAPFSFGNALLLVIVTGIIGYIFGCVFGWLWNMLHGAAHGR